VLSWKRAYANRQMHTGCKVWLGDWGSVLRLCALKFGVYGVRVDVGGSGSRFQDVGYKV